MTHDTRVNESSNRGTLHKVNDLFSKIDSKSGGARTHENIYNLYLSLECLLCAAVLGAVSTTCKVYARSNGVSMFVSRRMHTCL